MALIKPIHGEMKGSIGGNTWQGGRFGQVVRQRTKPVNPNSDPQAFRRLVVAQLNTVWKIIDQSTKEMWDEYAQNTPISNKFGDEALLTGRQMFIRIAGFIVGSGTTAPSEPPPTPGHATNPNATLQANTTDGLELIDFDVSGVATDIIQVQIAGPFANSRQKHKGPWRSTSYLNSLSLDPALLLPSSEMSIGQVYFCAIRRADTDGRLSQQFLIKRTEVTI